jgi:hypothetical protein
MSSPAGMMWRQLLEGATPLLSLGQLIQYLDEKKILGGQMRKIEWNQNIELCDALWQTVKEILEEE